MTLIDRRSLIKVGATAGFAMACGGTSKQEAAQTATSAPPSPPAAQTPKQFGMQFSGLFACRYSPTDKELFVAMPEDKEHSSYVAVDLRYVDSEKQKDSFDFAMAGPGGRHFGVWEVAVNKTSMSLENIDTTTPIKPAPLVEDPSKCPGDVEANWSSVSWIADLGQIQQMPNAKMDKDKAHCSVSLKGGDFGAVMPADPDFRSQKFVVLDETGKNEVKEGGKRILDRPLTNAIFYKGTITDPGYAVLKIPRASKTNIDIYIRAGSEGVFQVFASFLPIALKGGSPKKVLDHFKHYYPFITNTPKKQYPGIGDRCDKARGFTPHDERDIEPIYCPPAIVFEA